MRRGDFLPHAREEVAKARFVVKDSPDARLPQLRSRPR